MCNSQFEIREIRIEEYPFSEQTNAMYNSQFSMEALDLVVAGGFRGRYQLRLDEARGLLNA
jgi:hypothetical protein